MAGVLDKYQYYEYELDSLDATQAGSPGSLAQDWPMFYMSRPLDNIAAIKVLECQIPFSYYVISTENQKFLLRRFNGDGSVLVNYTVTLPVGNYTTSTMSLALYTALDAAMVAAGFATGTTFTSVTYSTVTGYFTLNLAFLSFTGTGPFQNGVAVVFGDATDTGNTNPRLWIGFGPGENKATITNTGTAGFFTSTFVAQVTGPNYVYINSNALGGAAQLYLPTTAPLAKGGLGPQVSKIPVTCNPGGVIQWQDPAPEYFFDAGNLNALDKLDFYVTMGNISSQNPLRFNGLGFSLKLGVFTYRTMNEENYAPTLDNGRMVKKVRTR